MPGNVLLFHVLRQSTIGAECVRLILKMFEIIFKILRYPSRYLLKLKFSRVKKLNEKFSIIYKNNYWDNKESISGPGSTPKKYTKFKTCIKKNYKKI